MQHIQLYWLCSPFPCSQAQGRVGHNPWSSLAVLDSVSRFDGR
jgi:hypothetical protein